MAKLPPLKEIQPTDVQAAPTWAKPMLLVLNSFMKKVWEALNGQLSIENTEAKVVSLVISGDDPTGSVQNPLGRPVQGVLVLQVRGNDIPTNAVGVLWQEIGNEIELLQVSGLTPGELYSVKLLII